jgi:hypothetical protein
VTLRDEVQRDFPKAALVRVREADGPQDPPTHLVAGLFVVPGTDSSLIFWDETTGLSYEFEVTDWLVKQEEPVKLVEATTTSGDLLISSNVPEHVTEELDRLRADQQSMLG